MTTPNKITSYPYNIDKITYLNLDDAYSSNIQSLIQRTQEQYNPNRLNMGVVSENCGLIIDLEYEENQGLSSTQLAQKYYGCCVLSVSRWLNQQSGMKYLSKCQLFQSCKRDCYAIGDSLCDIKCSGSLPVIPGKGTIETATYCDGLVLEYEKKYKQQYDQGIKTCKESALTIGQSVQA